VNPPENPDFFAVHGDGAICGLAGGLGLGCVMFKIERLFLMNSRKNVKR
jgi:hypothetical protein